MTAGLPTMRVRVKPSAATRRRMVRVGVLAVVAMGAAIKPPQNLAAENGPVGFARNYSVTTQCAEQDNVTAAMFGAGVRRIRVTATHPKYDFERDCCQADFSRCPAADPAAPSAKPDVITKIYDDGTTVVEVGKMDGFWRNREMRVTVDGAAAAAHYVRLYRKIDDEGSWPQYFVAYADGNCRMIPHPRRRQPEKPSEPVCFGSSLIIGPALPSERPFVDVERIAIVPSKETADVFLFYAAGGSSQLTIEVDRNRAVVDAELRFPTTETVPFAVFRSMHVDQGNCDVDQVTSGERKFPILRWDRAEGNAWLFHRPAESRHNTSAPDIQVEILR
jgi:hypothetical protein